MASDEEEEELAQLRAQRSQRTGVADLVRRAVQVTATPRGFEVLALFLPSQNPLCHTQRGLQQKQKNANTAAASYFEEPASRFLSCFLLTAMLPTPGAQGHILACQADVECDHICLQAKHNPAGCRRT